MRKILLLLLLATLLVSCKSGNQTTTLPQTEKDSTQSISPSLYSTYPKWFLESPYPGWFFLPPEQTVAAYNTVKNYRMDAYDRHCSYNKMRTKGFYRCFQHEFLGRLAFDEQDSISFYYIPDTTIDTTSFIVVDSLDHGNNKIYLTALDSTDMPIATHAIASSAPWSKSMERAGRVYGIGHYRVNFYNHIKGWFIAESNAIKDVMLKTSALIVTLDREYNSTASGQDMEEATLYDFDLLINNLTVERRWFDSKDGNLCVVVSCAVADVKKWNDGLEEGLADSVLAKIKTPETQKVIEETNGSDDINRDATRQKLLESLSNPINIDQINHIDVYEHSGNAEISEREKKRMQLRKNLNPRADTTHLE